MSPDKASAYSHHHVLDFLVDDNDSCALTVYTEDNNRMHIIADADKLKESPKSTKSAVYKQFASLITAFRQGSDEPRSASRDSGVDVSDITEGKEQSIGGLGSIEDAEEALQSWILGPVRRKVTKPKKHPSLREWYDAETQFFELDISKSDELQAVELEDSSELKRRMAKLKPEITLPKYIRDIGLPWFSSDELTVLAGSSSPPPYHPTQVRYEKTGEKLFFKSVDSSAPQVTKRELWHLNRISKADIVDQIRAPRLVGLVTNSNSHTHAIGFLQEEIMGATPLTHKLDADVPQEKRDAWAKEAERMKNVLHQHNVVWGDAKADNFLTDANDELWIIDFGGSWTEGWIDPEIKETVEGDDMALEKITNALHDPVKNVQSATEESKSENKQNAPREASEAKSSAGKRMKRQASEELSQHAEETTKATPKKQKIVEEPPEDTATEVSTPEVPSDSEEPTVEPTPQKRRKSQQIEKQEAERYCYCDSPSAGPMVGCDSPDCERQWFHFYCAGLKQSPPEDVEWFCRDCSAK